MTGIIAPNGWPAAAKVPARADYTRFVQRIRRRYPAELSWLAPGVPGRDQMAALCSRLQDAAHDLGAALRITRQLVLERLACLDCEQQLDLSEVTRTMTELAEFSLDQALRQVTAGLDATHGPPMTARQQRARLWVVGMGKLGARELNVSSDIDLIYVYDEDGETQADAQGRARISNQEYFAKVVRAMSSLMAETTEHGIVFRVDLALRPNGNSGPPAVSLDGLQEYFQVQGREWERFAWLKSRVVAPCDAGSLSGAQDLRATVLPFVFRRYLDYNVFDALRQLHRQIRDHAAKRSAGHPERSHDVKLSRGGIREIEFTVQLLQVVRGGQFPELRTRPTLQALQRMVRAGLMPDETAQALAQAYVFLRRVEHRIQYLDDQQTHVLPSRDDDLHWIAQTLGLDGPCALLCELDRHREVVAQEFDRLLGGTGASECKGCGPLAHASAEVADLDALIESVPAGLQERLRLWPHHPRVQALRDVSRARVMRLLGRTVEWVRAGRVSEEAAIRMSDWMESLLRRESYLALLVERPGVHERLLRLLGAARWPARYLMQHPGVIDELASQGLMTERFSPADFVRDLEQRKKALQATHEDDEEALLNLLRRAQHAEVFRTLARDLEGVLSVEQVADDLSALADQVLQLTTRWCWERLKKKHREEPQFAIIGYGKLGGKELGYGSDLDIVFVYEDDDEQAPEVYAQLVRKLINWLTVKTGEGDLYEIDTALRPNGSSGLLVTTFDAYEKYQQQRGSNTAWTWEHQAMTRARFVLGSAQLAERFASVREAVICAPRKSADLKLEIMHMRERVRNAHPVPNDRFDIKHSVGGMVDAEFAVQYLVLSEAARHPALRANVGNIALLEIAQTAGLLPPGVGHAAAEAYRELRRAQHQARLNEAPTQVDPGEQVAQQAAIHALWKAVFAAA